MCVIRHILVENGLNGDEISEECVQNIIIKDNFNVEHVVGMVRVALHFEEAYLVSVKMPIGVTETAVSRSTKDRHCCGHNMVSICVIKGFAKQFHDSIEEEELSDSIERLLRVASRNNDGFCFKNKTHVSVIIKRATEIAKEQDLHTIEDFVKFLEDVDDDVVNSIQSGSFEDDECCFDQTNGSLQVGDIPDEEYEYLQKEGTIPLVARSA